MHRQLKIFQKSSLTDDTKFCFQNRRTGFTLGAILQEIEVDAARHFIGGTWDWLNLRSLLVALSLIQGYVLIPNPVLKTNFS